MKESTIQEAYDLVVLKWERIIRRLELNQKFPTEIYSEVIHMDDFKNYIAGCAYCHLYKFKGCENCPLNIDHTTCTYPTHPYHQFSMARRMNNTQDALKYAIEVLKLIRKTKPQES